MIGPAAPRATMDHLVLAAATLADGIDYVASITGVAAQPGGKHVAMGTHNALLRLGDKLYLEIIAIDPSGTKPRRPRWFGLDHVALQSELTESPRLIHWVARTADIHEACQASKVDLGPVHAMNRGEFRWRITIPDDGALPGRGLVPTLIQWDVPMHPADRLPESNVSLIELGGTHTDPNAVRDALRALDLDRSMRVSYDRETRLCAMLRTPKGMVTLSS
ncbi:MAG TPA: VOC family protein [Casimicrobiaceae bacterium]|nr:VOC family protein [Casimicrobiaceae bacterium]